MRRYPAYDPPEYLEWSADAGLLAEYRARLEADPGRAAVVAALGPSRLVDLYRGLLRFRLHDIALQRWVKQGVISKAWLGTGEEAVTIGAVHALRRGVGSGDVCGPMIRNAGACHEMGMPLADMFRGYLGTGDGPARGRDLHIGDPSRGVVAPVSMVGGLATVVNGYALAYRMRGEDRVALTWIGDGSTKSGEVHEALNFAAVQRLPAVFVLQNNQVALGTRLDQHHRSRDFSEWGRAYGARLLEVDGNNVLDVHAAAVLAVEACRSGRGPVLLAAETFRMGGHATHDVREARATLDPELFARWGRRDPIGLFEEHRHHCRDDRAQSADAVPRRRIPDLPAAVRRQRGQGPQGSDPHPRRR
ncbi:MAG: thiamine pyrophosphate-dependent dehydrogenase E1 component subunit alpha [Gemmatimonadota bacterium]